MLIIALVLAVVSLAALVTAVVTSNEMIAWACIGFSALGVVLLIVDAIRDRHHRTPAWAEPADDRTEVIAPVDNADAVESVTSDSGVIDLDAEEFPDDEATDYPDVEEFPDDEVTDYPDLDELIEDHPEEVVHDEPDYDLPSDDEPVYPLPAEEAAVHIVSADDAMADIDSDSDSDSDFETAPPEVYAEPSTQSHTDDSMTIIYAGEAYTGESGESPTLTESYVVIDSDASNAVVDGDEPDTVIYEEETAIYEEETAIYEEETAIYAEETAIYADETADGSEERRESDSEH